MLSLQSDGMPVLMPLTDAVTAALSVGIWLGILLGLFCWLTFHAVEFLAGAIIRRFARSDAREDWAPVPAVVDNVAR